MKKQWLLIFGIALMASVTALAGMTVMDETDLNEVTGEEGVHIYTWIGHGEGSLAIRDTNGVTSEPIYGYTGVINWLSVRIDDGVGIDIQFNDMSFDAGSTSTGQSIFVYGIPDIDGQWYFTDIVMGPTTGTGRVDTIPSTWMFGNYVFERGSQMMVWAH